MECKECVRYTNDWQVKWGCIGNTDNNNMGCEHFKTKEFKYDIFIAHSLKFLNQALEYEKRLKELEPEIKVYIPGRDTPQNKADDIIKCNREAAIQSNSCCVIWDGVSLGTIFDVGMFYGMNKPVKIVKIIPQSWTSYMMTLQGGYLPQ